MDETPLSYFQKSVGVWGDATFPNADIKAKVCHLKKEVKELENASTECGIAEETADCFLLLLHIAHKSNFDLLAAAQIKMIVNRKRKWGKPDNDGVIEHVRD